MHTAIKHIISRTYKPLLERYLSRPRWYHYGGVKLAIGPEVFHPGFFYSTKYLLDQLLTLSLKNKKILELGCGSGLISIMAAKQQGIVTASDINPVAITYLKENSAKNHVTLSAITSDLFENIPLQQFDIVAINPPYYKKDPLTFKDHAWNCGLHGEYFENLFKQLGDYINKESTVLMVVSDGCDLDMIDRFAGKNGFINIRIHSKKNILEEIFIYKIERA